MARGDISVGIDYEGTEEGAQQLDGLLTRLTATEEAQNGAARSAKAFEDKLKATARAADKAKQQQDRLRAALASQISGWGALGGAIAQVGSVLGRVAPEFSEFGAVLADAGTSVTAVATALAAPTPGSITTALVSVAATVVAAVSAWQNYQRTLGDTSDFLRDAAAAASEAERNIDGLTGALRRQARARAATSLRVTEGALGRAVDVATEARERDEARLFLVNKRIADNAEANRAAEAQRVRISGRTVSLSQLAARDSHARDLRQQAAQLGEDRALLERRISDSRVDESRLGLAQLAEVEAVAAAGREEAAERAADAEEEAAARGGGGGGGGGARAAERAAESRQRETFRIEEEGRRQLEAMEETHQQRIRDEFDRTSRFREGLRVAELNREVAAQRREGEARVAAIQAEMDARAVALDQRRAENAEVASTLTSITEAVTGAFQAAIEGEKSLGEALLEATKLILIQFGTQMVVKGIGAILEGVSQLPSPTAAPKIAGGVAMVAFGVGLGAVGAAIPSGSAPAAEAPREDPGAGGGGGPQTLVLNVNNPVMAAATHAQLARGMRRQLAADTTIGPNLGSRR